MTYQPKPEGRQNPEAVPLWPRIGQSLRMEDAFANGSPGRRQQTPHEDKENERHTNPQHAGPGNRACCGDLTPVPPRRATRGELFAQVAGKRLVAVTRGQVFQDPFCRPGRQCSRQCWRKCWPHALSCYLSLNSGIERQKRVNTFRVSRACCKPSFVILK